MFGTSSPIWPGVSVPTAGWLPPLSFGARSMTATAGVGLPFSPMGTAGSPPLPGTSPVPEAYGFGGGQHASPFAPVAATLTSSLPVVVTPFNPAAAQLSGYQMPDITGTGVASLLATVAVRRGQPMGPTTDQEVEDFIYDALEWLQSTNDVDVRCEGGRVTLSGSVPQKRIKHDSGEIAWAIPAVTDVQNNISIAPRRRTRGSQREPEAHAVTQTRKQA